MTQSQGKKSNKRLKSSNFKHNLQPPAGILNVFSRLNYKPHYALAEFVDNSTQSYLLHEKELRSSDSDYKLSIIINYDANEKSLFIKDNAFGMTKDRFLDAITLDAKNTDQIYSRNEFGMGLKTAASWFGNIWRVTSTALGSSKKYTAIVDIPYLQESGENEIDILVEEAPLEEHGTTVTIQDVTKGMGARAVGKTRSLLASMYRRDLQSDNVSINVNGQDIQFQDYDVLTFRDRHWRKDLDFDVVFGGRDYRVTGFVGIMNPGGFPKAGFALFRRNRVIIGGEDQNYKPREIFGQAQSQISLKLFGELNMDDFPVNQAKDGFIWDDGLEDEFIAQLKENIRGYIEIARMSKDERAREEQYSDEASKRVENEVAKAVENLNASTNGQEGRSIDIPLEVRDAINFDSPEDFNYLIDTFRNDIECANEIPSDFLSSVRSYRVSLNHATTKTINVRWEIAGNDKWTTVVPGNEDAVDVTINVNHKFFKPYSNEEEFQVVLEKFVIAFVVAEEQAKLNADKEGYILSNAIRSNMNGCLRSLSEE